VPFNAKLLYGALTISNSAISTMILSMFDSDVATGAQTNSGTLSAGGSSVVSYGRTTLTTPRTIRYSATNSGGTPTFGITMNAFEF
jgi:hypothetical protein